METYFCCRGKSGRSVGDLILREGRGEEEMNFLTSKSYFQYTLHCLGWT